MINKPNLNPKRIYTKTRNLNYFYTHIYKHSYGLKFNIIGYNQTDSKTIWSFALFEYQKRMRVFL